MNFLVSAKDAVAVRTTSMFFPEGIVSSADVVPGVELHISIPDSS